MLYNKGYYLGEVSVDRESHCFKQWKELMQRCYSDTYKKRNPKSINKVCDEWNCYDNFYKWYHEEGFEEGTLTCKTTNPECHYYSKDTCYILPLCWVRILSYRHGKGYAERYGKYYVRAKDPTNKDHKVHLGVFDTKQEAHRTFIKWKLEKVVLLKSMYSYSKILTLQLNKYIKYLSNELGGDIE